MTLSARESTKETAQANETFDNWRIDCCIRDRRRRDPNGHREVAQYRAVEHFVESFSTAVISPIVPPVQTGPGSGDNEAAHSRAEQAAADARAAEDRAAAIRAHEARQSSPSGPGQEQETE
jgi:hypothetical protein